MALVHEFENSGNWLFKRRSWLPVFMIAAGIVMMYLGNRQAILFDMRDELIFLGVSLFGQIIRILTVGFTPKNTSGRNTVNGQIADELNVTGIYSLVTSPSLPWKFLHVARSGFVPAINRVYHSIWTYYTGFIMSVLCLLKNNF